MILIDLMKYEIMKILYQKKGRYKVLKISCKISENIELICKFVSEQKLHARNKYNLHYFKER